MTKGPKTFDGSIGKLLHNCEKRPVVEFESIEFHLSENISEISNTISTDQSYLFNICSAISKGICDVNLASRCPGNLCHSRFLTTANRLCRLYISTTNPSQFLILLVKYILWVYAPAHFSIKSKSSCIFGSIHLANIIRNSRFLHGRYLKTFQNTISRNAFFAHPENVLLAMLNDDDENVRCPAWQKIIQVRKTNLNENVRTFNLPRINFDANNYLGMINIDQETHTVPPILKNFDFTNNDATNYAKKK